MYNIIPTCPETPDPSQLDLFDTGAKDAETVQNSTDSAMLTMSNEAMIRSPTAEIPGKFDNAGSLHRKSRELAKKFFNQKNTNDDNVLDDE